MHLGTGSRVGPTHCCCHRAIGVVPGPGDWWWSMRQGLDSFLPRQVDYFSSTFPIFILVTGFLVMLEASLISVLKTKRDFSQMSKLVNYCVVIFTFHLAPRRSVWGVLICNCLNFGRFQWSWWVTKCLIWRPMMQWAAWALELSTASHGEEVGLMSHTTCGSPHLISSTSGMEERSEPGNQSPDNIHCQAWV